jgi:hypothetical protein
MHDGKQMPRGLCSVSRRSQVVPFCLSGPVRLKLANDGVGMSLARLRSDVSLQFCRVPSQSCGYQGMKRTVLEGSTVGRLLVWVLGSWVWMQGCDHHSRGDGWSGSNHDSDLLVRGCRFGWRKD